MTPRVLIIEDNDYNIYLLTYILEHNGCEVFQARDGLEGIRLSKEVKPDLILLDIQLPTMDGYAVAGRLRSDPTFADIPIIAVTSHAMVGDREKTIGAGCTGYIEKPINPDTFITEILQYLPKRGDTNEQDFDSR
jgi:CheY-like chemotaxis protein